MIRRNFGYIKWLVTVEGHAKSILVHIMNDLIRIATISDSELLLAWRNNPNVRQFSKSPGLINEVEHIRWLEKRLAKMQSEPLFVFISDGKSTGTARLDECSEIENSLEVSILIDPEFQGLGKSKILLDLVFSYAAENLGSCKILAQIHNHNLKSINLFESVGFSYLSKNGNFLRYQRDSTG